MSENADLPPGYRWATAEETEAGVPEAIVVPRTADNTGKPYTHGEADIAVPLNFQITRGGRHKMDLTINELATALTGNDFTEADAVDKRRVLLTVRPKGSSRTFTADVIVTSIKEV